MRSIERWVAPERTPYVVTVTTGDPWPVEFKDENGDPVDERARMEVAGTDSFWNDSVHGGFVIHPWRDAPDRVRRVHRRMKPHYDHLYQHRLRPGDTT